MKRVFLPILAAFVSALPLVAQDNGTAQPSPKVISLDQAIEIALSENASVKVADMEIERTGYARKGTYSSLFPQVDGNANYQRTIKKQVM